MPTSSPFPAPKDSIATTDSDGPLYPHSTPKMTGSVDLPCFIKPLPAGVGPDEIDYLGKKGALTVPTADLRDELLRSYVEFVHPFLPVLDLPSFISIVDGGRDSRSRLSLILYHAVMFAGSTFVSLIHLQNAGYVTRKEAQKDFFRKTKVSSIPFHLEVARIGKGFDRVGMVACLFDCLSSPQS